MALWPIAALAMLLFTGMAYAGTDRSPSEHPGDQQGDARSDPDGASNGGEDKPGGTGGVDKSDQDGNNGCGNDDDREDDNNGNCGGSSDVAQERVEHDHADETSNGPAAEADAETDVDAEHDVDAEVDAHAHVAERGGASAAVGSDAEVGSSPDFASSEAQIDIAIDGGDVSITSTKDISFVAVVSVDGSMRKVQNVGPTYAASFDAAIAYVTAKASITIETQHAAAVGGTTDEARPASEPGGGGEAEVLGITLERPASQPAADDEAGRSDAAPSDVVAAAGDERTAPDDAERTQQAGSLPTTGAPLGPLALGAVTAIASGVAIVRRRR